MRSLAALLIVALLISGDALAARRRPVQPRGTDARFLQAAIETANWLLAVAQPRGEALAWPSDMRYPTSVVAGLPGTSGAGLFFLRLYQVTRDGRYLDVANRAASFVASNCSVPLHFDWQGGTVGCGEFLIALYRETKDPLQLERAEALANWLISSARVQADGSMYWESPEPGKVYTGIAHGAAGAGIFLLHVYEQTHDPKYLEAAEAAYRWMAGYTLKLGDDGIGWKRLTTDTSAYNGWCGGSAGTQIFLQKLWRITAREPYRTAMLQTANGLLAVARRDSAGTYWEYYSRRATGTPLVYCHGTACAIGALAHAYVESGESRYLTKAEDAALFLKNNAESADEHALHWPHLHKGASRQNGFMMGGASIGHAYLRLYRVGGDRQHLEMARRAGNFLLRIGDRPAPGQLRWAKFVEPVPEESAADQAFKIAWWDGTSGIGMFLVELHEAVNGLPTPAEFSPANP